MRASYRRRGPTARTCVPLTASTTVLIEISRQNRKKYGMGDQGDAVEGVAWTSFAVIENGSVISRLQGIPVYRPPVLLSAVRKAATGEMVWRREDLRRVTGALSTPRMPIDVEVTLTQRESEVLHQLAHGLTNKQIAEALSISYETVKEHVQHILRKIGVSDRTQAAVWAVRQGLV